MQCPPAVMMPEPDKKNKDAMRLSSVTLHGKTATGRPGRISTTAFLATRALKLLAPDSQLPEMEGATDDPATINMLSVFSRLSRTV